MKTIGTTLGLVLAILLSTLLIKQTSAENLPDSQIAIDELMLPVESLFPSMEASANTDSQLKTFASETIEAPISFNVLVPQWTGAAEIDLRVRTSPDAQNWSEWQHVHPNHDWMEPGEALTVGDLILVAGAHETHRFAQFQLVTSDGQGAPRTSSPTNVYLTFIDSTKGPTTSELLGAQNGLELEKPLQPASGYPKPSVISRAVWCTQPDCVYNDGLEYHPVSHLIIHHTTGANSNADWAAIVRATWMFHVHTRGWRDIGYQYLIDPNGVIYEGHYGGDDVVGIHASAANKGSMAVALLGTYSAPPAGTDPSQPMLDSTIELLAWKTDQRDINIFESSRTLPNVAWGLPHLMGHRDVNGSTDCPGNQAHLLIPWLREQIAGRIGQTDLHIYTDDLSTSFTKSGTGNWYVPPLLCGYNNHAWYTWTTTKPPESTNWGEWRFNVPANGRYRVEAYIPYCITNRTETQGATYTIEHAGGTAITTISHVANLGLWTSIGEFELSQGNNTVVRLSDLTTTDKDVGIWFDAIRILNLDTSQGDEAQLLINPATQTVTMSGGEFCVQVRAQKIVGLTAFEFELDFPPDLLEASSVSIGPFLSSSGRGVVPITPKIDNTIGEVRYAAYSTGNEPGVSGDGDLATVCFMPEEAGTAALNLTPGKLIGPGNSPIPVTLTSGSVTISSCYFADFNCDNEVDISDIQDIAGRWGKKGGDPIFDPKYDLDSNGEIDIVDVQKVASEWGWPNR